MDASRAKELQEELNDSEFLSKLGYSVDEDLELDDVREDIETSIREHEVIYFATAMEILSEYDQSLSTSVEYAVEYGIEIENINSELLATLFMQGAMMNELSEINLD